MGEAGRTLEKIASTSEAWPTDCTRSSSVFKQSKRCSLSSPRLLAPPLHLMNGRLTYRFPGALRRRVNSRSRSLMIMHMPRILYLSSCWPHDKSYGGQLRALQNPDAPPSPRRSVVPPLLSLAHMRSHSQRHKRQKNVGRVRSWTRDGSPAHGPGVAAIPRPRLSAIIRRQTITNIHGMAVSSENEAWLNRRLQERFDLVWFFRYAHCERLLSAEKACWRRSVVDIDDLPSSMEKSQIQQKRRPGVVGRKNRIPWLDGHCAPTRTLSRQKKV